MHLCELNPREIWINAFFLKYSVKNQGNKSRGLTAALVT